MLNSDEILGALIAAGCFLLWFIIRKAFGQSLDRDTKGNTKNVDARRPLNTLKSKPPPPRPSNPPPQTYKYKQATFAISGNQKEMLEAWDKAGRPQGIFTHDAFDLSNPLNPMSPLWIGNNTDNAPEPEHRSHESEAHSNTDTDSGNCAVPDSYYDSGDSQDSTSSGGDY